MAVLLSTIFFFHLTNAAAQYQPPYAGGGYKNNYPPPGNQPPYPGQYPPDSGQYRPPPAQYPPPMPGYPPPVPGYPPPVPGYPPPGGQYTPPAEQYAPNPVKHAPSSSSYTTPAGQYTSPPVQYTPQSPRTCPYGKQYYVCYSNGFKGCCSVDACNLATTGKWCPDYDPWTYNTPNPPKPPTSNTCPAGSYATCGTSALPPGTCAPGSGQYFYRCSDTGFSGCCSVDACSLRGAWCPDYNPWTYEPSGRYRCPDGSYPSCKKQETVPKPEEKCKDGTYAPQGQCKEVGPPNKPGNCPKSCEIHYNSCDKTTAPTCIFPDPYAPYPRGACACRPGYKASYHADGDTTKQWRLPIVGQEHRVWVAEGVPCDALCKNPYGVDSCREVTELGKECVGW